MHPVPYPEYLAARSIIAEAAAAVLDGRLGVLEGARVIAWHRFAVDPEQSDDDLLGIAGVESQTDHLPLGPERWTWPSAMLDDKESEIAREAAFFRDDVLASCRALVARYAPVV